MSAYEFRLPDLGEGIEEAEVLGWRVLVGQTVAAFDPLCEVESAKAAVELTSPVGGRVAALCVAEGAVAHRGDVLLVIETLEPSVAVEPEWFGIVGRAPEPALAPEAPPSETRRVFAAPIVRKRARELGIRLEEVHGSGPHGRVRMADLESFDPPGQQAAAAPLQPATPQAEADEERVPLRGLRRQIAEHMLEAVRTAPQVTAMDLFDVTELVRARELLQRSGDPSSGRLTYLALFVKAAIEALRAVPEANATLDWASQVIVLKRRYHIGIATAVPNGLVVPVVRDADRRTLVELAHEIERLAQLARERRLAPADLAGGTFTITSFGGLPGSPLYATPILNVPEVAILGLGRIDQQPRVVAGQVVARHCLGVSFTFDHRVLDGEGAGRFMAQLRRYIEQPLELLLRLR